MLVGAIAGVFYVKWCLMQPDIMRRVVFGVVKGK